MYLLNYFCFSRKAGGLKAIGNAAKPAGLFSRFSIKAFYFADTFVPQNHNITIFPKTKIYGIYEFHKKFCRKKKLTSRKALPSQKGKGGLFPR